MATHPERYDVYFKALDDYANLRLSKRQFYGVLEDDYAWFDKNQSHIKAAEVFRAKQIKDRKLEVVYICGSSGSGKTTLGKYLASRMNFDYFVSGSGDDILDGYDKEECIILDDFRGGNFFFSELLKFLDNNTNSSIKSRYYNKDVSNCKLVIITSVQKPSELYLKTQKSEDDDSYKEPAEQLYRRLKHHYFNIEDDGNILEYKLNVDIKPLPTKFSLGSMYNIYEELGIDVNSVDDDSMFNDLLVELPEETEEQTEYLAEADCNGFIF